MQGNFKCFTEAGGKLKKHIYSHDLFCLFKTWRILGSTFAVKDVYLVFFLFFLQRLGETSAFYGADTALKCCVCRYISCPGVILSECLLTFDAVMMYVRVDLRFVFPQIYLCMSTQVHKHAAETCVVDICMCHVFTLSILWFVQADQVL